MKRLFVGTILVSVLAPGATDALLWRDTGTVSSLDLAAGPGGRSKAPQPPFTFIEEDLRGTAPKVTVKDGRGATWSVKFGEEAKAETFATRIAWAAGYYADATYFVPNGEIRGTRDLTRAAAFINASTGKFSDARFELRDEKVTRYVQGSKWALEDLALKDSRELGALKVLLALLSNWDVKPENSAIVETHGQQRYAITDWGASMGRASDITGRSKWDCVKYATDASHLVESVDNGFVTLKYDGKHSHEVLRGVRVEHVDWLMQRLSKLTDTQIQSALRASGATPDETACFSKAFRVRLEALANVRDAESRDTVITNTRREIKTIRKPVPQR